MSPYTHTPHSVYTEFPVRGSRLKSPIRALASLILVLVFGFSGLVLPAAAVTPNPGGAVHGVDVDFSQIKGAIRPLHGVNNGPYSEGFTLDLTSYFRELTIPYVRLHEPNYPSRGCVHLQYIFPDMTADPDDPANYNFAATDDYIAAVIATGAKVIYNLGFGNHNHDVRGEKYRAHKIPPEDNAKIARICVNVARHYNQGWANGFHYNIEYWDIWNEPNAPNHWAGSVEQYFELYAAIASAMKADDPKVKVGGPSLAEMGNDFAWLERFLALCRQHAVPLDFCSWHSYGASPITPQRRAREVKRLLETHGYPKAENLLMEWSPVLMSFQRMRKEPLYAQKFFEQHGSIEGGAFDIAVLCYLQDSPVDIAAYYGGDTDQWGFIERSGAPKTSYYGFKAFRRLLDTPVRVEAKGEDVERGIAVLAGISEDRKRASILIANFGAICERYEISLAGLPWSGESTVTKYLVDGSRRFEAVESEKLPPRAKTLTAPAGKPSIVLVELAAVEP